MKYALWNNKGGVGKTFLSFVLATEYAKAHPDSHVVVIDMCPQANVSEILLGGNGKGTERLAELIGKGQTIGGYFDDRIASPHGKPGTELQFFTAVSDYNRQIPDNLSLVAGDPSLELQSQTINGISVQSLPQDAWKNVHSWVIDLQQAIQNKYRGEDVMFFIDCNPSFSSYTAQAIAAAERLIVPCTPDGSSARAIRNVCRLVYGRETPEAYQKASFANKIKEARLALPVLHLAVLNRSTQYRKRPAKAFQAMLDQIRRVVEAAYHENRQDIFGGRSFEKLFSEIPDAHTVAIVCSSQGKPLFETEPGPHTAAGKPTTINREPLDGYKEEIAKVVAEL